MRRILVLGGTGWLGREIARQARDSGAEVVCVARGESGSVPDGVEFVRTDRSRLGAYDGVGGAWDEVIELASEPQLVESALDALADRAAHWTLVSTVSVYADNSTPGADETAPLVEPQNLAEYPDAKVAAERASAAAVGDRLLIARPGLIAGPGDPSDRLGYWPARLHRGGDVLAPTTGHRFVQFIDVDDLAAWIVGAGAAGLTGAVNAVGEVHTMDDFLRAAGSVAGFEGELITVDDEELLALDVHYWAGPRSLPLWLPIETVGFAQRAGSAFVATGGRSRPLADTLTRVLTDEISRGLDRPRRSGLTVDEEQEVLAAVR
ncbi:NAD-dependent epimerase/dehydratase family protein [Microbacterium sp. H37-C3]|uniref:NAD-dependent epimerase/dehydratase family protein n=1 Tax=Microbacterium sp. H37-C3 TaxID=3004354 RepID=UPI0022AF2966|nr:NAD-dependent epimerase/dehydratase family protein [Microbacterium sp. H37-C3]MCZ4067178.1 NAD-dependent epimerase/dehydratase family protein [Microbacterium sp. H37-C3]